MTSLSPSAEPQTASKPAVAELRIGDRTFELPIEHGTEGYPAINTSSLLKDAGLTTLDPPLLYRFPSRHVPTESGVSGMILMVQSHCAFHWWPLTTFLHVTISSCLRFDPHRIIAVLLDRFSADHVNVRESAW